MINPGGQRRKETSYLRFLERVQIGDLGERDAGDENVALEKSVYGEYQAILREIRL